MMNVDSYLEVADAKTAKHVKKIDFENAGGDLIQPRYVVPYKNTVLVSSWDGTVAVIDFMPPRGNASDIVRLIRGVSGRVKLRMELIIRFGFGVDIPWVKKSEDDTALLAICGQDMTVLRTPIETRGEDFTTVADFEVGEGETVPFVLTYGPSHLAVPDPINPAQALQDTENFWIEWCSHCSYEGEYRDLVLRSLITLKAQTFAPTGGSLKHDAAPGG